MTLDKAGYEVLSPWADADPIPLKGLAARPADLAGKKIGLLVNVKRAARPILTVVERKLKERYPSAEFSWYAAQSLSVSETEPQNIAKLNAWINGVDAVVGAVGD